MNVTISKEEYDKLLQNTNLLDLYMDIDDQQYHLKCSFPDCKALCLRDWIDYERYYQCESMETCDGCNQSFCNLHVDLIDNLCRTCTNHNIEIDKDEELSDKESKNVLKVFALDDGRFFLTNHNLYGLILVQHQDGNISSVGIMDNNIERPLTDEEKNKVRNYGIIAD